MEEPVATDIRFFDLNSRIGRLRYLAYGLGLGLLFIIPVFVGGMLMAVSTVLGMAVLVLAYVAMLIFSLALGVRRLHDLDKSGWWLLLMIVPLVNLGMAIYLLFFVGTIGENRFGPQPPPNSGWVIAGAVAYIAVIPLGIIAAISIPAFADYTMRAQMSEGVQLAGGGEAAVTEYAQAKQTWPTDLAEIYPVAKQDPAGRYVASVTSSVSGDGSAYGIVATMKTEGVSSMIAGTSVETWTNDGGQTWHCGPGGSNPVDDRYLPASCRTNDPPPP